VMCLGTIADKFRAFNWHVTEIDGHDVEAIHDALLAAKAHDAGPAIVIAHTIKGKGVSFMEGDAAWHGKAPSAEQVAIAVGELTPLTEGSGS
jgi:transketolase